MEENKRKPSIEASKTKENISQNDDTFLVLVKRRGKFEVRRFNKAKSLYLYRHKHPVRKFCILLSTDIYFEYFILLLILANCVFLALKDPPEEPEYMFACLYTLEMMIKIIARGFAFHKHAYLRDPWNVLDFVVVILGWLTITPYVANLSGVRTFRVLRALRTISQTKGDLPTQSNARWYSSLSIHLALVKFEFLSAVRLGLYGLKTMVNTLLVSMRMLSDVLVLIIFFLCVFSLLGMQLFMGELRNKCVVTIPDNINASYSRYVTNSSRWLILDGNPVVCGNTSSARTCSRNYSCYSHTGSNPNYNFTSFDHVGWAFLTSFQLLTLDFWEDVYNNVLYAAGLWNFFFFAVLVFLGPFYLINLISAVVVTSYEVETTSVNEEDAKNGELLATAVSAFTFPGGSTKTIRPKDTNRNIDEYDKRKKSYEVTLDNQDDIYQLRELEHREPSQAETSSSQGSTRVESFRKELYNLVSSRELEGFITLCIVANTVVMATEHYGMSSTLDTVISMSNYVFTGIFFAEVAAKLVAFGAKVFFRNAWCVFDLIVVAISLVDIGLELSRLTGVGLRVLRTFRLLRVLKLAKSWTTMNNLLSATAKSLGAFINLALVMCIVLYMFAVTGMQLFGDSYTVSVFGSHIPRWNFTDFGHSFMLIFRVVCGEWIEPLWDCMRASNSGAVLLFIPAFIMGNFVVLNLFLALVVNSFSHEDTPVSRQGEKVLSRMLKAALSVSFSAVNIMKRAQVHPTSCDSLQEKEDKRTTGKNSATTLQDHDSETSSRLKKKWCEFRERTENIVKSKFFEWFILFIIMISSICLAFEDVHLRDDKDLQYILYCLDIAFVVIFSLEFLLKLIGLGFVRYFSNGWNYLDLGIVIISILSLTVRSDLAAFRSLRTLRALRPLRAISRFEGLKIVIGSLFSAIPGISNVLLVGLLSWLIFSIMGVQLFGGKFYKCIDSSHQVLPVTQVPNKTTCLEKGFRWENSNVNYDNVVNGLVALTQVATLEGWIEIMKDAVDSTGVDQQPKPENNLSAYIYFVVFIILGSFFVLNLIVGVIIDKFSRMKQLYEDTGSTGIYLSTQQIDWLNTLKKAATKKPSRTAEKPKNQFRGIIFHIVTNNYFEMAIMLIIAMNMATMMLEHYGQDERMDDTLEFLNYFFTGIFIGEAIARITALGTFYFRVGWNVFDFVVVVLSVVGILLEALKNFEFVNLSLLRGIRAFRITRLLRFIKAAKGIRKLTFAFVLSLPALFNICCLLVLIISIYAIVGMTSFGFVKKTGALNDVVNFETFVRSFVLLFRLMTSAGWNEVLDSLMIQSPDCDPNYLDLSNGNCGRPIFAQFYFVSFVTITYIILVNMYIAIILENFNRIYKKAKVGITDDDLDMYYSKWALYDPKATEYIYFEQLADFVGELNPPLRVPKSGTGGVETMDISLRSGDRVHCLDLLHSLVKHLVLKEFPKGGGGYSVVMERLEERFMKAFPRRNLYSPVSTVKQKTLENKAALTIQRAVKRFKARTRTARKKTENLNSGQNCTQTHSFVGNEHESNIAQNTTETKNFLNTNEDNIAIHHRPPSPFGMSHSLTIQPVETVQVQSHARTHKVSEDLSLKSVTTDSST